MVELRLHQVLMISFIALVTAGCVQENNPRNLRMGDVTLGQQLIDLKKALEAEAISDAEYQQMKAGLVAATSMCADNEEDGDDEDDSWLF